MSQSVRRAGVTAAILICGLTPATAIAQQRLPAEPPPARAYENPTLRSKPPTELGGGSATPTPTPTPEPTATATPEPTTPQAATPSPSSSDLPRTGSDPLRVALAGMALLGFGLTLRLRDAGRSA